MPAQSDPGNVLRYGDTFAPDDRKQQRHHRQNHRFPLSRLHSPVPLFLHPTAFDIPVFRQTHTRPGHRPPLDTVGTYDFHSCQSLPWLTIPAFRVGYHTTPAFLQFAHGHFLPKGAFRYAVPLPENTHSLRADGLKADSQIGDFAFR